MNERAGLLERAISFRSYVSIGLGAMLGMGWVVFTGSWLEAGGPLGAILGFGDVHTRAHMYRSMLEAIVLTMKNHMDAMCVELDLDLDQIIVSGGGSSGGLAAGENFGANHPDIVARSAAP